MTQTNASERSGFSAFRLDSLLERGIAAAGFLEPRPIQSAAIPAALASRDILGLAQTGTGKTAAFALPILDRILVRRRIGPLALVLAPTRELASQIDKEIRLLAQFTKVKTVVIYGGVPMDAQIRALRRKPDIIVACPGRLLDLYERGEVSFRAIEALVLDEADHMFDMGFLPAIQRILEALPEPRQNLLFSATMPKEIRRLADEILRDAHVVELEHSGPAPTIDHALYPVHARRKAELLQHLLTEASCTSAIVFTRTKHRAKRLADQLEDAGHRAVALQGNMSQVQRDRAMGGFRRGEYNVLVATDIAARGIDVSNVSHVINFDVPNSPEAYTHRIGRTGRGEREGQACTFVTAEDGKWVEATERFIGSRIARCDVATFTDFAEASGSTARSECVGLPELASHSTRRDGRNRRARRPRFGKRSGGARR